MGNVMNRHTGGTLVSPLRRRLLAGGLAATVMLFSTAVAASSPEAGDEELRFPGDPAEHNVVYQLNKADESYQASILFSAGEMLRKYGDNIKIVIVAFGPGIHILLEEPARPVSQLTRERVSSLADYGVEFHACGNTLKSLQLTADDLLPFAKYVEVGAADLMELQEQGFSYISW